METYPNGAGFRPEVEDVPATFEDDLSDGLSGLSEEEQFASYGGLIEIPDND